MATKPKTIAAPTQKKVKAGIRSTEFWLAALTSGISLLIMAGVIDPEGASTGDKIAGLAIAALASLGYSISRGLAKHKQPE